MLTGGARELAGAPLALASRAVAAVGAPRAVLRNVSEGARGVTELLGPGLVSSAPETPLNVPIGSHRLTHWVTFPLGDLKAIKNALGGTLNDVVVAVVTGALRRVLQKRGVDTAGLELRAMVPVSVRTGSEDHQPGNRVAAMRAPLPVHLKDPVDRLRVVSEAMSGLKESKQALGAETLMSIQEFAPPTLLAMASRINFSTRLFNVIVTNIPGPQFPLYLLGRQLREFVPMVFLPQNHALAFAILSYNGRISFGLLADREAMPEVEFVAAELERAVSELLERAGDATA